MPGGRHGLQNRRLGTLCRGVGSIPTLSAILRSRVPPPKRELRLGMPSFARRLSAVALAKADLYDTFTSPSDTIG